MQPAFFLSKRYPYVSKYGTTDWYLAEVKFTDENDLLINDTAVRKTLSFYPDGKVIALHASLCDYRQNIEHAEMSRFKFRYSEPMKDICPLNTRCIIDHLFFERCGIEVSMVFGIVILSIIQDGRVELYRRAE